MNIGKIAAACLAAGLVVALPAEEPRPSAGVNELSGANKDAVLDTIAQINHINWVVNVIKSYNNVIVLEEEYEKISPGNLYLDRIPDEETLNRITKMLDTLYSLRKDDRQMKKWRIDFRESRDRKIRDHKHKATKEAVDTITGQVKECCSLWDWATNPLGSIANVVGTAFNMAHYSVGLHNDYDNFVYELDKTAKDKQFDFDGEKLDLLHNQNKEILQDQWQFIRRYNLDDRLRVSDVDIKMLLNCLKNDNPAWIFTRLYPMRERFSLFPEYWYYLSCAAMETGHFKEGLEACDTFFKVNRGLFRDDPMVGTVAFNKAFMLPKTKENKPEVRRCLELAWTKNANVTHPDWQLDYLAAIMYKGVFDETEKAEMMFEHAIALIEQESRERTRYGSKAGVTLEEGLLNCRNALHQLRGEPLEEEPKEEPKKRESEQGPTHASAVESPHKALEQDQVSVGEFIRKLFDEENGGAVLYVREGYDDGVFYLLLPSVKIPELTPLFTCHAGVKKYLGSSAGGLWVNYDYKSNYPVEESSRKKWEKNNIVACRFSGSGGYRIHESYQLSTFFPISNGRITVILKQVGDDCKSLKDALALIQTFPDEVSKVARKIFGSDVASTNFKVRLWKIDAVLIDDKRYDRNDYIEKN